MIIRIIFLLLWAVAAMAQNAGIGIVPTKGKLEVSGSVGNNVAIFGGDGAGISLQQNWPALGFNQYYNGASRSMVAGSGWVEYLDMNSGSLAFDHCTIATGPDVLMGQFRRLTIRQNGNVSINHTEANASLFVGGGNLGLPSAVFRGTNYSSYFYEQALPGNTGRHTYINGGKPNSLVLLNDKAGGNIIIGNGSSKVGINTSNPTATLYVKQTGGRGLALINPSFAYWEFFVEKNLTANGGDMYVYYKGGNLGNFFHIDGKYYAYSDRRVKKNIQPLSSVLAGILALKPCTYEMKFDNPGQVRSLGLVAQEARQVFPEITGHLVGDDLGYEGLSDLYTIDYNSLGPLALKAVQEQQEKLARLRLEVDNLKRRIAYAESRLKLTSNSLPNQ